MRLSFWNNEMPNPHQKSIRVRRVPAAIALLLIGTLLSLPVLRADPPEEEDAPPPPMTESHIAAEAEAAAAVVAVQPVLREARALQDRMPPNVSGRVQAVYTAEYFQRYTDRVESRREAAEQALESRQDGNLTESELEVELAKLELRAYGTAFDAIADHMQLEGAILSATTGRADWSVGDWTPNRSAEDIEKEKQRLSVLVELAEALIAVRERVLPQRLALRVKMMRVVRRAEAHDPQAAEEMAYEVERRFRESYIDGSIERPGEREFNLQLRNCKVASSPSPLFLTSVDAFIAPNILARARQRLRVIDEGRAPRRRTAVSITDVHGNAHDGRVVSPGMTLEVIYENEGSLLLRQSLMIQHYRDGQPLIGGALPLLYMDPRRAQDEGYARLIGRRGDVHLESLYVSNKVMFITQDQMDSPEARIARGKKWQTIAVQPGDVIWIMGEGFPTIALGVEPAQNEVRLIDVATDEIVPLEEMRYGVSYKLEIVFGERQATSDLRYQIAWGEGRNQNKEVELSAVVSSDPDVASEQVRNGYTQYRSRPLVFDDLSLPAHPRRAQ